MNVPNMKTPKPARVEVSASSRRVEMKKATGTIDSANS